jgi:hypothetical protein
LKLANRIVCRMQPPVRDGSKQEDAWGLRLIVCDRTFKKKVCFIQRVSGRSKGCGGYVRVVSGARKKERQRQDFWIGLAGRSDLTAASTLHLQFDDWRLASVGGLGIIYFLHGYTQQKGQPCLDALSVLALTEFNPLLHLRR